MTRKKEVTSAVLAVSFLAALSSSRSVVVCPSVGPSVGPSGDLCEKVIFRVLNGNLNLPIYLPM